MAEPRTDIVQMAYQNPHASAPLHIPVAVVCNTSDADLERNVRANSARDLDWIACSDPRGGVAVLVGGGASVEDHIDDIRALAENGAFIFAMNAASSYLNEHGIRVDAQVIADAKPETAQLVDLNAARHMFASQCHEATFERALDNGRRPKVWHLEIGQVEDWFPEDRLKKGGYALIGGGAAVGNAGICLAFALGYREFHVFGYDSCHKDGRSHAYDQPMNKFMPCTDVTWAGRTFTASLAMKAQAEKFQITGQAIEQAGGRIHLYGDGLLQTMWNTPAKDLAERDKYRLMWQMDSYRTVSPGEDAVPLFLAAARPDGLIADFGCGTGRASIALANMGHEVVLIDFADNSRDEEAKSLPFIEWDLTRPCPVRAPYGLCTDVMEHIPPEDVETVIVNIMASSPCVFFQISTVDDVFGAILGTPLHLTVKPHDWWRDVFESLGFTVEWQEAGEIASCFLITCD